MRACKCVRDAYKCVVCTYVMLCVAMAVRHCQSVHTCVSTCDCECVGVCTLVCRCGGVCVHSVRCVPPLSALGLALAGGARQTFWEGWEEQGGGQ